MSDEITKFFTNQDTNKLVNQINHKLVDGKERGITNLDFLVGYIRLR